MILSIGFAFVLILIILPGLLFRRFYFYGEFSKQFSAGLNIAQLTAKCVIPGFIFFSAVYVLYDKIFNVIALEHFIWKFQELGILNSSTDVANNLKDDSYSSDTSLTTLIKEQLYPFLGYLYATSGLAGWVSGRSVRITGLDTRYKLLRFKNSWFYLFTGKNFGFKKLKQFKLKGMKLMFTKADILIDCSDHPRLYSGIVVDYEISDKDCDKLERVTLQSATRYSTTDGKTEFKSIPGQFLVVDCCKLLNINLTYVASKDKGLLETKWPQYIELSIGIFALLLIPLYVFKIDAVTYTVYQNYFELGWFKKILVYLASTYLLGIFNPFTKGKVGYSWATFSVWVWKTIFAMSAGVLLYFLLR